MKSFRHYLWGGALACLLALSFSAEAARTAKVTVQSQPAGAEIFLDGRPVRTQTPARLVVSPGSHTIGLSKPGYAQAERSIEVYDGEGFASFTLQPELSAKQPAPVAKPSEKLKQPTETTTEKPESHPDPAVPNNKPAALSPPVPAPEREAIQQPATTSTPRTRLAGPAKVEVRNEVEIREKHPTLNLLPADNPFSKVISQEEQKEKSTEKAESEDTGDTLLASLEPSKDNVFPLVTRGQPAPAREPAKVTPADDDDEGFLEEGEEDEDLQDASAEELEQEPEDLLEPEAEDLTIEPEELEEPEEQEESAVVEPAPATDATTLPASTQDPFEPKVEWPESAEARMYKAVADLPSFPEKFNILLLGLDRRDARGMLATGTPYPLDKLRKRGGRSDVIMVVQLDFVEKQVRIVSVPRDTKARIPGRRGWWKINAAYAFGREKLARRVVSDFLDIDIHRTVVADWYSTKKAIGLFKDLGMDYNGYTEKEMFWHLRKRSFRRGDFHRIERQQKFLRYAAGEYLRMINELKNTEGAVAAVKKGMLDMAMEQGLQAVETDMTMEEVKLLTYAFKDYDVRQMTMTQVKGRGGLEGGDEEGGGVYFFRAYTNHSFDALVAKAETGD